MLKKLKGDFPYPTIKPELPPDPHGWLSHHVEKMFKPLIKNTKCIIEIGSWLGLSTRFWLENSDAHVICIDTWEGSPEHQTLKGAMEKLPTLYETFIVNQWKWRDRVTPIKMWSTEALKLLTKYEIEPDFIYIDANHEFNDVYLDIVASRSCFPAALIGGDDWNFKNKLPGRNLEKTVQKAVRVYCGNFKEEFVANHWAWRLTGKSPEGCSEN